MWPRFGIKLGNSTLCIAYIREDGKAEVIANKQGNRTSEACLLWDDKVDEIECGLTAKQKMATRPKQAVANSFQLLLPLDELTEIKIKTAIKEIPCKYDAINHSFLLESSRKQNENDDDTKISTKSLTAQEVYVKLLRAELELAHQYHNHAEQKPIAILSIPSYYPMAAWNHLTQVAEEAGFHVAQIITEPTAAVLAYKFDENEIETTKFVLTVKSGGLFSHFALYAIRNGLFTQLDCYGPFNIGGRHYTDVLVEFICDEFQRKYKLDPNESLRSMVKIRTAAVNCKHILSTLPSTQLYIDSLMDGIDYNSQMSRARFDSLIQPVINNFMQTLNECIDRALQKHPEIKGINSIVLLGATMQIQKLQAAIATRFPEAQLHNSIPTDEVVAIGCSRQAAFLIDPKGQDLKSTDDIICSETEILIWHGDDEENAQSVISKGTLLPTTILLNIKLCENIENKDVFRLRADDEVHDICLEGAASSIENGVFHIEANVTIKEQGDTFVPIVRLRTIF